MSIKFQHTPGPWVAVIRGNNRLTVEAVSGELICCPSLKTLPWTADLTRRQMGDANGRLIAAAPELLEALTAIVFQVCQDKVLERDACIAQARAAIAKATKASTPVVDEVAA